MPLVPTDNIDLYDCPVDFRYTANTSYSPTNSEDSSISFDRITNGKLIHLISQASATELTTST